jgi:ABC-type lipoprotein release transport system permease subunit
VAAARHAGLGDDVPLIDASGLGVSFRVVGVFKDASRLLTNDLVVLSPDAVSAFFAFPAGMATDIVVGVHNPAEVDALARKVHRLFPDSRPITRKELLRTYDAVLSWRSGMLLAALAGAILALTVLAWDKATGLSAEERREIGILKALGWDTSDVLEIKGWEGLAMACLALSGGLGIAFSHVFFLDAVLLGPILKGWSVLFPPLALTPRLDYGSVAQVAFLVTVPYLAATVIPSWNAAKADPDEVMRG